MFIITKSIPFASLFSENVLKEESLATELLTTDLSKKSIQKTCKNLHGATSSPEEGFGTLPLGEPDFQPTKNCSTGSCPCQPFSNAGKRAGTSDTRHLWPHFYRLIAAAKPSVVFGEQVSSKLGYDWFDGVAFDLESQDYQCEAVDIPACAVNAPHKRNRLYWIARLLGNPDEGDGRRWIQTEEQLRNESFAKSSETNVADSNLPRCGKQAGPAQFQRHSLPLNAMVTQMWPTPR